MGNGLSVESLYESDDEDLLSNGVDKTKYVKLNTSIYLYGGVYDHIYVRNLCKMHKIKKKIKKKFKLEKKNNQK